LQKLAIPAPVCRAGAKARRSRSAGLTCGLCAALLCATVASGRDAGSSQSEAEFMARNDTAMAKMMRDMAAAPSGDIDRDFVNMMVPHHQGAIDMAVLVLRYGHNEKIRRLAQEIIVDQQQEIAAMRLAVDEKLPPSAPAPTTMPMIMR
jgi:hypothetical protein